MSDKIKIVYLNLCDQDATIITPSTEDAFYPASNLKDYRTTKKFRTTAPSGNVVFDFITAEEVDTVMVRGDAIAGRGFNSTLTIQANATDSWGAPAYEGTLTFSDKHNIGILNIATVQSYRYWRIVGSGSSYFELSNICIGKSFIPARNISTGFSFEQRDLSEFTQNDYGQRFQVNRVTRNFSSIGFKLLDKAGVDEFMTMFDITKKTGTIWVNIDNSEIVAPEKERFASQFFLRQVPQYSHIFRGYYNLSLTLEEVI